MLWKLIFVGALVAAGIVLVPPLLEGDSPASDKVKTAGGNLADGLKETAQNEIKESGIDKEELAQKAADKGQEYIKKGAQHGANLILESTTNHSANKDTIVPSGTVSHKDKPDELHTVGFVFENKNGMCKISAPAFAETVNGQRQLTRVFNVSDCQFEKGQPVIVKKTNNNENNGDNNKAEDDSTNESPKSSTSDKSPILGSYEIVPVSEKQENPPEKDNDAKQSTKEQSKNNDQPAASKESSSSSVAKYDSIELSASRMQNGNIELSYSDPSKDTQDISITMKNSQKQVFSGKYNVAKFENTIGDVSYRPHIIEATVQHAKYGTLFSSVYVPEGKDELTLRGSFVGAR